MRILLVILLMLVSSPVAFSQNSAVGMIEGNFNVGNLGEAVYSFPIELPDGINGTAPKLSIEYNSNAGNDILGVGFLIGGLSAVSRVGKTIYYDGVAKGVNYGSGDEFALDGVRIIKLSTNNYALENDPSIEISRAASFAQANFIVKSVGNTMTYGAKVRGYGNNVSKWLLSDVCDVFGNHIKYTYLSEGRPATISYSGHSVKFIYENRQDTVRTILNGRKINSVSRLKQITVNKYGNLWRTYDFQYNTTDGLSRLSKITLKNANGEQLPPMTFSYNTATIGQTAKTFSIGNNARWEKNLVNFYDQTIVTGDYDSDGLDDIILTAQVNVPTGANTCEIYTSAIFYKNVGTNNTPSFRFANSINIGACWYDKFYNLGVNIMDFDGDGKNEFFVPMYNGPFRQVVFRFYDGMRAKYYLASELKTSNEMPAFAVSDFIGNGKFAVFFIEKGKDKIGKYPAKIMCFDDNFTKKIEASFSFSLPSAPTNIFASDYNGDGMIDILVVYDGGYTIYWNAGNGIRYSTFSDASKCSGTTIKNCALIRPGDFNGDGYMDFVMSESNVDAIYFAISNGDGTFTKKTAITGLGIYDHSNTAKDDGKLDFEVFDFNGDGKSDIVATKKESTGKTTKYSYGKHVVTTTENGRTCRRYTDDWGNPTTITDPVSSVRYTYKSNGQPCKIVSGGATFTIEYNPDGTRKSMSDPDAGKSTYEYDALGRVIRQTDGRGIITSNKYSGNKLVKTTCGNEITEYKYNSFGKLAEQKNSTATITYQHNNRNLVELETYSIDGKQFKYTYRYNLAGQLTSCTYPDGVTETYNYDQNHLLSSIKIGGQTVWMLQTHTGTTLTEHFGSKLTKTTTFTNQGILSNARIKTNDNKTLHSMSYGFQSSTGNLVYRGGMSDKGSEYFQYDKADRLVATERMNISYSANGNIINKTGLGNYAYSRQKPHAVEYVQNTDTLLTSPLCKITYTPFGKVSDIKKQNIDGSNNELSIHYSPDFNRIKTVSTINGQRVSTYHLPNYEEVYDVQGFTRYHYIDGAYGLVAVRISGDKGSNRTEYAFTDHLGSITRLYDENGNERFAASYDPFGHRTISNNKTPLQRGYCGHIHYDHFGLIDMGGRVYDPILGRFLSPDPYVQAPENSQNYNRYSYCLNNPLKYTDPTGEFVWLPVIALASTFAVGNLSTHLAAGDVKNFGQGVKMFVQGTLVGATLGASAQIPGVSGFLGGLWNINKWGFSAMGVATLGSAFVGAVSGKNKKVLPNSLKMIGGLFSLDDSNFSVEFGKG